MFRIFNQHGFLQLSIPQPITVEHTDDWGFPDKSKLVTLGFMVAMLKTNLNLL